MTRESGSFKKEEQQRLIKRRTSLVEPKEVMKHGKTDKRHYRRLRSHTLGRGGREGIGWISKKRKTFHLQATRRKNTVEVKK